MPGIVGLITKAPRERAEPLLWRMLRAIQHDPSFTTGTWIDDSIGVYVGWALHPGSFCDRMPLVNESRDVVLVFSGEEYSRQTIATKSQRQRPGCDLSDASYLLDICQDDPSFPAGLNGRFQGLSIDKRGGHATLFNDRSGIHRLYYHQAADAFFFAVEAKAILAVRPDLGRLDSRGLGEYLTCGCVLGNRTLFSSIHVLPPGSAWRFRNGAVDAATSYFDPADWEDQDPLDPDAYYEALRDVFSQSLPRYFRGPGRVGMSVTGGLDTRMIMAWWNAEPTSIPCYSFAGTYRDAHDVRIGKRVAQLWGQSHTRIEVGDAFLSQFAKHAERTVFLTDGCADVSCSPILYTNELVRAIAPTRMTGNYGSEVVRGSRMFKAVEPMQGLFSGDLTHHLTDARQTYNDTLNTHPVTFAVTQQAPWHNYGIFALEGTQLTVRSPFLDNDLVRTVYRSPAAGSFAAEACLRLIADGNPSLRQVPTDMGLGRSGIRGSVSRRVLTFTFKADYAYNHGMPQWLAGADRVLSPLRLERLFLGRHKYAHFRVWYRDALSKYVQDMLLDSRTLGRPYVNRSTVERVVARHVNGTGNYTFEIHKLLTLELLHRSLLDRG
jgi:asparagine synthase (glutamine-hydrolysing)